MTSSMSKYLEELKSSGSLALFANLLFEMVLVGWIAFAGLYSIEVLLPTFVTARISLVKFSILLIGLTTILSLIGTTLPKEKDQSWHPSSKWILGLTISFALISLAVAHYRFPWWTIPICVAGYVTTGYLFWKNHSSK